MTEHITKSAFARRLGVTPARVSQLVAAGLPVSAKTGLVPVEDATRWLDARAKGDEADTSPLSAARVRSTNALAELREFDLARRRGEFVSRMEVERALAGLSERFAPQLAVGLDVSIEDATAALDGIAARIAADASLDTLKLEHQPNE